ncbi:aldehyde ferredoxin oxidoreductase family protein [Chloroflexota bacterium]
MTSPIYGYNGRLLRIDLTEGKINVETLDESTLRKYVGGTGLGVKILYEEVASSVNCYDPENRMTFASGPLGGTKIGGSGTYSLVTLGALTNGATTCQANGLFGAYLRFSGFDGIVIQGASEDWVYIHIHNGKAEIRDARHLLGLDSYQTEDAVKKELKQSKRRMSVATIGPAGENLVRFAVISSDRGHIMGHNGNGAVMGSKKLKAIAVSREGEGVKLKDPERLSAIAKEMLEQAKAKGYYGMNVYKWGTLEIIHRLAQYNTLPVKNLQTNIYGLSEEELGKWSPEYIRTHFGVKRNPCWACQMNHCYSMKITEGPYAGEVVEEAEYEGMCSCGSVIGNKDVASAIVLSNDIDRLGIDVNEAGWLLAFTMECYEKGILTKKDTDGLEMTWGNIDASRAMVEKIARREGFGAVLAEGVMRAAQHIGGEAPNFAVHSGKGNAPRTHDHRINWSELFDTCVSNTGTIETGTSPELFESLGLKPLSSPFGLPQEVSTLVAKTKGSMQFEDSLGVCKFNTLTNIALICGAVNAATGWDINIDEAMAIGRRAVNLTRVFNLRRGISTKIERPSPRWGSIPADSIAIGVDPMADWDKMLENYYELMGWDKKTGIPLPKTLDDLGLSHVMADLPLADKKWGR